MAHPLVVLLRQTQELLDMDGWVLVPDCEALHVLHQLCLGQGEVGAPRGARQAVASSVVQQAYNCLVMAWPIRPILVVPEPLYTRTKVFV